MISSAHIELEHWHGPRTQREHIAEASVPVLRERLASLDGRRTDCLWIEIDDIGSLSIGGGPDRFIVVSFPADGSSSHVEIAGGERGDIELQVGGQVGLYPGSMVLGSDTAFAIAERFLLQREYDSSLGWVQDCPPGENE